MQGAAPGALDGYLDSILPVMEADLFGDIAEAKEADVFAAKYRSAVSQHHITAQLPLLDAESLCTPSVMSSPSTLSSWHVCLPKEVAKSFQSVVQQKACAFLVSSRQESRVYMCVQGGQEVQGV